MSAWMIYLVSFASVLNSAATFGFIIGLVALAISCVQTGMGNSCDYPIAPKYFKWFAVGTAVCGLLKLFVPSGDTLKAIVEAL